MRLTRTKLISDLQNPEMPTVGHFIIGKFEAHRIDLKREIIHHHLGNDTDDEKLFAEMALWCFDNCNGKWCIRWNLDDIFFTEETDRMGFMLRWM